ncbi:hypothetical protein TorRG33x02_293220 [Trema orientale]|uniref:Uncharacterized protein n=1 Tax=Trema orientale TaxID=63057 RepID=A0A2P5C9R9_TREOI|nr:hypothetical protein TorRG33x02_293220 [Trema orientale]
MVMVLLDTAAAEPPWPSNHGTNSSPAAAAAPPPSIVWENIGGLRGKGSEDRVAWLTMDSRVPPARGFSGAQLVKALFGTRGGPKPCMAIWPFSHVSSATS